jgi:hypothetical protein
VLLRNTATHALHKSQTNIKPVHTSGVEGYPVGFV